MYAEIINPGTNVRLFRYATSETGGLTKETAQSKFQALSDEFDALQDLLYAAAQNAVLVVLQGMDTSGKDGTIRSVFRSVDPLGCRVWPFKVPTPLELAHDFLWRVHDKVPERGMMTVFNRSHYEDVVVVRVKNLVPEAVWSKRYEQINNFEELLVESGTILIKFFLHISKEEQKERLLDREKEPAKAWKLSAGDWLERKLWDQYAEAYEAALSKCSTELTPWRIVPADRKWFRDLAVAEAIVDALRPYRAEWEASLAELGKVRLAEVLAVRAEPAINQK